MSRMYELIKDVIFRKDPSTLLVASLQGSGSNRPASAEAVFCLCIKAYSKEDQTLLIMTIQCIPGAELALRASTDKSYLVTFLRSQKVLATEMQALLFTKKISGLHLLGMRPFNSNLLPVTLAASPQQVFVAVDAATRAHAGEFVLSGGKLHLETARS